MAETFPVKTVACKLCRPFKQHLPEYNICDDCGQWEKYHNKRIFQVDSDSSDDDCADYDDFTDFKDTCRYCYFPFPKACIPLHVVHCIGNSKRHSKDNKCKIDDCNLCKSEGNRKLNTYWRDAIRRNKNGHISCHWCQEKFTQLRKLQNHEANAHWAGENSNGLNPIYKADQKNWSWDETLVDDVVLQGF